MKQALAVGLLAAAVSACGGTSSELDVVKAGEAGGSVRVIVADIDSSINPYHEYLYAGSPIYKDRAPSSVTPEVLAELGIPEERQVTLTRTGNLSRDKKTDAEFWKSVRRNRMYWFKGTNLIAMSLCSQNWIIPDATDPNKDPHGVGTSSSVFTANPDAIVLFVEACTGIGSDEAHRTAFLHPAVDIVTTSYGFSIPNTGFPLPEVSAFGSTFDGVVTLGKLHFSSGGNGSGLTPLRAGAGPWWSIGVSGNEEYSSNGDQQGVSGNFPDFVSDFSQDIPYCLDCERGIETSVSGTSFSTPRAAGVASRVLLEARMALGHTGGIRIENGKPIMATDGTRVITNWDIRRALEVGAYADYTVSDYDPVAASGDPWPTSTPVIEQAPWLQIGWGDLTADPAKGVVKEAMAYLGFGTPSRQKAPEFCDFQTKIIEARKAYWDNVAIDSADRTPPSPDPFVFCGSSLPGI